MICSTQEILSDKHKNDMGGARSTYGEEERSIQVFDGEHKGTRPLGRIRR